MADKPKLMAGFEAFKLVRMRRHRARAQGALKSKASQSESQRAQVGAGDGEVEEVQQGKQMRYGEESRRNRRSAVGRSSKPTEAVPKATHCTAMADYVSSVHLQMEHDLHNALAEKEALARREAAILEKRNGHEIRTQNATSTTRPLTLLWSLLV